MVEEAELSEHDRALYAKLHASLEDISTARSCAAMILKKEWHTWLVLRRGRSVLRRPSEQIHKEAFTTTMIVTYSRPFCSGRGNLNFPDRLLKYSREERTLHDRLLELRNKQYAHADASTIKVRPLKGEIPWIASLREVQFSPEEITLFLTMTRGLIARIEERMEEIRCNGSNGPERLTLPLKA
jgi:hypothetical protein